MLSIPTGTKCAIAAYAGLAPDAGRIADSGLARIRASRYDQAPGSELGRGNLNRRPSTGIAVMVANVAMRTSRVVIVGAGRPGHRGQGVGPAGSPVQGAHRGDRRRLRCRYPPSGGAL